MMELTYFGHSCFLLDTGTAKILFDPFITPNELAKHIDISTIHPNYILISHGHEDHVADALEIATQNEATIVSNYEIVTWFQGKGVAKGHPMNIGGQWNFDFGKVKYVNAVHSSVLPDGTYGGNPGGFIIQTNDKTIYFAGDTALNYDMKLLGEMYNIDYALLPIGDNFTMGTDEAIKAAEFIQCNNIIGMHYDTFGYIKINHKEAQKAFSKSGKNLTLLEIGKKINL